jgi:tetratricopeptide (TPR) repeat protein
MRLLSESTRSAYSVLDACLSGEQRRACQVLSALPDFSVNEEPAALLAASGFHSNDAVATWLSARFNPALFIQLNGHPEWVQPARMYYAELASTNTTLITDAVKTEAERIAKSRVDIELAGHSSAHARVRVARFKMVETLAIVDHPSASVAFRQLVIGMLSGETQGVGAALRLRTIWSDRLATSDNEQLFFSALDLYRSGRWTPARRLFEQLLEKDSESEYAMIANHLIAKCIARRKGWKGTGEYLGASLELNRRYGDRHGEAMVLHSLGRHLLACRDFEGAKSSLRDAIDELKDLDDVHGVAMTQHTLGNTLIAEGDYETGLLSLSSSHAILTSFRDTVGVAQVAASEAKAYIKRGEPGDLDRALPVLDESRRLHAAEGLRHYEVESLRMMAKVYQKRAQPGDFEKARTALSTALDVATEAHLTSVAAIQRELGQLS